MSAGNAGLSGAVGWVKQAEDERGQQEAARKKAAEGQSQEQSAAQAAADPANQFQLIPTRPSSNVATVLYREATKTLRVVFVRNGRIYHFHEVPKNVVEGFRDTDTGRYFRLAILNQFPYEEVS